MVDHRPITLKAGQSRPLKFCMSTSISLPSSMVFEVHYCFHGNAEPLSSIFSHTFSTSDMHSPHKISFLHPSGTVSYAILRPPSRLLCSNMTIERHLPILLCLHGAGLEASSDEVRHMLDSLPDLPSWILFPTGGTPWSGDDWRMRPVC